MVTDGPCLCLLWDVQKWSLSPRRTPNRFSNVSRATWRRNGLGRDTDHHLTHCHTATHHLVTAGLKRGVREGRTWTLLVCVSCHLRWRERPDSSDRDESDTTINETFSFMLYLCVSSFLLSFQGIVHPRNENPVIVYSLSFQTCMIRFETKHKYDDKVLFLGKVRTLWDESMLYCIILKSSNRAVYFLSTYRLCNALETNRFSFQISEDSLRY